MTNQTVHVDQCAKRHDLSYCCSENILTPSIKTDRPEQIQISLQNVMTDMVRVYIASFIQHILTHDP